VVEQGNETLTNIVAIAAGQSWGLALRTDGTVMEFGDNSNHSNDVPAGLNNVVSIAIEGDANWAIKRDGTVTKWGGEPDAANVVASLSNIISITYTGYKGYLALKNDGIVLGFCLDDDSLPIAPR